MSTVLLPVTSLELGQYVDPGPVVSSISHRDLAGLRVVFINMPLRESAVPNTTPEGPLMLATNLRDNYGVEASIIDLNAYRIKDQLAQERGLPNGRHLTLAEAEELIKKHILFHGEPNLVAFSGIITTLPWQKAVAKLIRRLLPDVFLVSGNGLATELRLGLFNYIPELDGVAHSEGDEVILKIAYDAKAIRDRGRTSAVNWGEVQPYYRGFINGRHRFLYDGGRPKDLDSLAIADLELLREDVNGNRLLECYIGNANWGVSANNSSATSFAMSRSTTFVSSRGCPHACDFCFRGAQGERTYGVFSGKRLARIFLSHIDKYGVDFIGMPDDNFAVTQKRIVQDIEPWLAPLKMRWGTHTRMDEAAGRHPKTGLVEDPKRIDSMAKAGCVYIGFGAESASPPVLEAMHKGGFILSNGMVTVKVDGREMEFPRSMVEGTENCEYAGIHANCTWIMAYPTETLANLKQSVAFMRWQEQFYAQCGKGPETVNKRMFTATWYPGTSMGNHPKVRQMLWEVFGIQFDQFDQPICDENFEQYVLELDDATKLLHNPKTGDPLNYSDMPMDVFLRARELVDSGRTLEILDLTG